MLCRVFIHFYAIAPNRNFIPPIDVYCRSVNGKDITHFKFGECADKTSVTRESFGHIRLTRKITIKKSMTFSANVIDFLTWGRYHFIIISGKRDIGCRMAVLKKRRGWWAE